MKQMTVMYGIALALVFAIVAPVMATVLGVVLNPWIAQRLVIAIGVTVYAVLLVQRSPRRSGRIFAIALIAVLTVILLALEPGSATFLFGTAALVWVGRSLLLARGLLHAVAEGALVGAAYIASCSAAFATNSLTLAVWSFFLVLAAGPFVASYFRPKGAVGSDATGGAANLRFERAYQSAEGAIGVLSRR